MATSLQNAAGVAPLRPRGPRLDQEIHPAGRIVFLAALIGGIAYAALSVIGETANVHETLGTATVLFLIVALMIALGFEFVNGFHDTANAVATVIYTHSMPAPVAVVWSGVWNFIGVIVSTGAVAYGIVALLPVELILNVGSSAGFAMIFALLLAAVVWNVATWYVGLPNSSSHALIGSILGVGFANQLLSQGTGGTSGVDWGQAQKILSALLISPMIGFIGALLLLFAMRLVLRNRKLFEEPDAEAPPPLGIRALLILTCTSVSFAHGGNDGQKGMGLIMLILIGCAPTAYALNRAMPASDVPGFVQSAGAASSVFRAHASGTTIAAPAARDVLTSALKTKHANSPEVYAAIATIGDDVAAQVKRYGSLAAVPAEATTALRNQMYLVLDGSRIITKDKDAAKRFAPGELKAIGAYQKSLEGGTRYIPVWVKVAVAIALGLGTMVGWKRIVITVGERIGKTHMTYAMGASAELVAAGTILSAESLGLPVSTTHILTSGVAGASVANGQGLQLRTILNMVGAWLLTLPATITIAGMLYWLFLTIIRASGTV